MTKSKELKRLKKWLLWRKHNANSCIYQICVLFGLTGSPTFDSVSLPEEWKKVWEPIKEEK